MILIIGGYIFYVVYPKYHFAQEYNVLMWRCNKTTGMTEFWDSEQGWTPLRIENEERQKHFILF